MYLKLLVLVYTKINSSSSDNISHHGNKSALGLKKIDEIRFHSANSDDQLCLVLP